MRQTRPVALVDDDTDDRFMTTRAWNGLGLGHDWMEFPDGDVFLDYLSSANAEEDEGRPGLVLLDLNMPRVDGWEVLRTLKGSPDTRRIPVIVLTTSQRDVDVYSSYDLGAAAFVSKPETLAGWSKVMERVARFWLESCTLP